MLTIRLQRTGRKHEPTFRVVLTESKNGPKSGKFLEILGAYDPRQSNESLKADRIKYWISQGTQTSDTVHNLLINQKVINGKKINVLPKKSPPPVKEEPKEEVKVEAQSEALVAEVPAPEVSEENKTEPKIVEDDSSVKEVPVSEVKPTEEIPAEETKSE